MKGLGYNDVLSKGKKSFLKAMFAIILVFVSSDGVMAQGDGKMLNELENIFLKADFGRIVPYMNDRVEIILDNSDNLVSKNQAKNILSEFFSKNKPLSVKSKNNEKQEDLQLLTYLLHAESGNFHIFVVLKDNLIIQIKINNEKRS